MGFNGIRVRLKRFKWVSVVVSCMVRQKLQTSGGSARVTIPESILEEEGWNSADEIPEGQRVSITRLDERCYVVRLPTDEGEIPDLDEAAENSPAGQILQAD